MTDDDRDRPDGSTTDPDELAQEGGVGLTAGEPNTFEPEEDPEADADPA